MRISDWSSDVCSSDLGGVAYRVVRPDMCDMKATVKEGGMMQEAERGEDGKIIVPDHVAEAVRTLIEWAGDDPAREGLPDTPTRSEEHTSELQSLMRISYAVFCLKNKKPRLHHTQPQ